jgi:hypothetical protein
MNVWLRRDYLKDNWLLSGIDKLKGYWTILKRKARFSTNALANIEEPAWSNRHSSCFRYIPNPHNFTQTSLGAAQHMKILLQGRYYCLKRSPVRPRVVDIPDAFSGGPSTDFQPGSVYRPPENWLFNSFTLAISVPFRILSN